MNALLRFWFGDEREGGQANVLLVIVLLGMIMMVGLAIDAGQLFVARRHMQEAADAAAFAGAVSLYQNGSDAELEAAARADATANGYTNGVNGAVVTFRRGPASGAYINNTAYVEIIISQPVRTTLVPAQSSLTQVTVRGVAGSAPVPSEWAIITLHRAVSTEFDWGSSGNLSVTGAGIMVDSSNPNAANHGGSGQITFPAGATFTTSVVGGYTGSFPNLLTGQPAIADPYAGTPKPETTLLPSCTSLSSAGCQDGAGHQNPGVYEDVTIDTSRTLNPGMYILKNSSILDNAVTGGPTITATGGVTLWLAAKQFPANSAACGEINVSGGSLTISAPGSGPYKGFAIVQEKLCSKPIQLRGSVSYAIAGTVYAPGAQLQLSSNGTPASMTQLVIQNLVSSSSATLTVTYTAGANALGLVPALSE